MLAGNLRGPEAYLGSFQMSSVELFARKVSRKKSLSLQSGESYTKADIKICLNLRLSM